MNKLHLSALAAALAFASTAYAENQPNANANANAQANAPATEAPMTPPTTAPTTDPATDTTTELPANHGQAVSQVAQETRDGQAVSTMAHSMRDFKKLDADKDGFLTQTDIATDAELTAQFGDWDDDKDTKLSQAEYDAYIASTVTPDDDDTEEAE
jgi:hypothetical protein